MIRQLLKETNFGADEIRGLTVAHEIALQQLNIKDRSDPLSEMIASKIIELARRGERDPATICATTLKELASRLRSRHNPAGRGIIAAGFYF